MDYQELNSQVNELFRKSASLRAEGRYTEALAALRVAADLITKCVDSPPPPDEPTADRRPVTVDRSAADHFGSF